MSSEVRRKGKIVFGRHPGFSGVETLLLENSSHSFPAHSHDHIYALGLMESGACYYLSPGREGDLISRGEICLLNPSQVHSGIPADWRPVTYRMLYLDRPWVNRAAEERGRPGIPEFSSRVISGRGRAPVFRRIASGILRREEPLTLEAELFDLLFGTGPVRPFPLEGKPGRSAPPAVLRAMEFLSLDLSRNISLEETARAAGSSRYHLIRLFREATGLTPHAFRTVCRVDLARELLRKGQEPSRVCFDAGFCDQSHFIRTFKAYTGLTPREYRG